MKPSKPLRRKVGLKAKAPLKRSGRIRKVRKVKDHEHGHAVRYPNGVGGREVCLETKAGKEEYARRTNEMWERQHLLCPECAQFLYYATFDHENGRGGGKRDDRIVLPDGTWINAALHLHCNQARGSKRTPYKYPEIQQGKVTR